MNVSQLTVALEVAKAGSISRAAETLYLSQPHASSVLRSLEQELGYAIFRRTSTGVLLTEQGERFLPHAKRILNEFGALKALEGESVARRLNLGVMSYAPMVEAFIRLATEYSSEPRAELSCVNIAPDDGFAALRRSDLDVFAALISPDALDMTAHAASNSALDMLHIGNVTLNINLREGHPLVQSGAFSNSRTDLSALKDFPYVGYSSLPKLVETASILADTVINCKYRIAIDERDTRCRIVSMTDAFSIGCRMPSALIERYRLATFPISDEFTGLYLFVRRGEAANPEIARYIELITQEVASCLAPKA